MRAYIGGAFVRAQVYERRGNLTGFMVLEGIVNLTAPLCTAPA
jgi:hypothetical protein